MTPSEDDATPEAGTPATEAEIAALKAERDELAHEVEVLQAPVRRARRFRGVLAIVGVFLSCVLILAACLGTFARRSFMETDNFSNRAGSLIDDPGVQTALSNYLTGQLNQVIDPEQILQDALPDQAQILSVPLAGAIEGFVGEQVSTFVASDTFAELWKTAVSTAHREVVRVLRGDTPLLEESEDHIVINLLPIINEVLARLGEQSPELLGRNVDLPTITVDDVPDVAREAIENALGVTLDENFGTFTIYDDGALSAAQEAVSLTNKLFWVLVVLVPLAVLGTLAISPRRRRTLLQLSAGIVVSMVLIRRLVFVFQDELLGYVRIESNVPAVKATSETFLDPLTTGAFWVGIAALVIAVVAAITGPYPWAVKLRRGVVGGAKTVRTAVVNGTQDPATIEWVGVNVDRLRIGGAVVGLVLLWWLDLSWIGLLLLALLVGAYELVVQRLAEQAAVDEPAADATT